MDGWVHFRSNSGPLGHHSQVFKCSYEVSQLQFTKKLTFTKFAHRRTNRRMDERTNEKNVAQTFGQPPSPLLVYVVYEWPLIRNHEILNFLETFRSHPGQNFFFKLPIILTKQKEGLQLLSTISILSYWVLRSFLCDNQSLCLYIVKLRQSWCNFS